MSACTAFIVSISIYYILFHSLKDTRKNLYALQSGETKTIRLFIKPSAKLEEVNSDLFTLTNAPVLAAKYYTVPVNQDFEGEIWSNELARFEIQTPRNEIDSIHTKVLKRI